jgi:hypothetical protein
LTILCVEERRIVVRLILLIPVYGILSYVSIVLPCIAPLFDGIREWYEAMTALFFFQLVLSFCVDEWRKLSLTGKDLTWMKNVDDSESSREEVGLQHLTFVWQQMRERVAQCKNRLIFKIAVVASKSSSFVRFVHFTLALYIFWCLFLIPMAVLSMAWDCYNDGDFSTSAGYTYIKISRSLFICPAIISLLFLVLIISVPLEHRAPISKFITIKAIVFINFWQLLLIKALSLRTTPLRGSLPSGMNPESTLNLIFLCFEMVPLSVVCAAVFPPTIEKLRWPPKNTKMSWIRALTSGEDISTSIVLAWRRGIRVTDNA